MDLFNSLHPLRRPRESFAELQLFGVFKSRRTIYRLKDPTPCFANVDIIDPLSDYLPRDTDVETVEKPNALRANTFLAECARDLYTYTYTGPTPYTTPQNAFRIITWLVAFKVDPDQHLA